MKQVVVITTINEKTRAILEFEKNDNWYVIVVGDKKSKHIPSSDNLKFLTIEEQKKLGYKCNNLLPYNHYTRKNIGYLYAIQNGAEIIYDTDDDNYPYPKWGMPDFRCQKEIYNDDRYLNVYQHFSEKPIWPRGFPLRRVLTNSKIAERETQQQNIGIWQGLADDDPDVDAIYRLVYGDVVKFEDKDSVYLSKGTYCPFNSQNTFWRKETFAALYLPATVSFRFTDILRGYIAQKLIWELGLNLGFTSATVYQERNEHDLMKDFKDEIECYLSVEQVVNVLEELSLKGSPLGNLATIYTYLNKNNLVDSNELDILHAWLQDVDRVLGKM